LNSISSFVASSSDFDEGTQVVSFSSRQTKAIVYIRVNDDNIVESSSEAFKVELLASHNSGVRLGRRSTATCYIRNGEHILNCSI